jgi:DNA-binding MarR family transcriptional regulator
MDRLVNLLGVAALAAHDRATAELGHGETAAAMLVHLAAHPGGSVEELRRVVGISQPAAVRAVDRLVATGLLERRAGPDRRTLDLRLTAAGSEEAHAVLAARSRGLEALLAGLPGEDRAALERGLEALVSRLAEDRPGALRRCRLCDRDACTSGAPCPLQHTVTP